MGVALSATKQPIFGNVLKTVFIGSIRIQARLTMLDGISWSQKMTFIKRSSNWSKKRELEDT